MNQEQKPVDVLAVLDGLEWGFNHRRCPLCAGFDPKGNGETDRRHTDGCPFPKASAAIAELIAKVREVVAYEGDSRFPQAVLADNREILSAALHRVGGQP